MSHDSGVPFSYVVVEKKQPRDQAFPEDEKSEKDFLCTTEDINVLGSVSEDTEGVCCGIDVKALTEAAKCTPDDEATACLPLNDGLPFDETPNEGIFDSKKGNAAYASENFETKKTADTDTDTFNEMFDVAQCMSCGDESSVAPPPPPPPLPADESGHQGVEVANVDIENPVFLFVEKHISDSQDKGFETNKKRQKKILLFVALFVFLIFVISLSAGLSKRNKQNNELTDNGLVVEEEAGDGLDGEGGDLTPPLSTPTASSPVSNPTVALCTNLVKAESSCYALGEAQKIKVTFKICNSSERDWIGIYPKGSSLEGLGDPDLGWVYTCGNRNWNCDEPVAENTVEFDRSLLSSGEYQLYLFSNADGAGGVDSPYTALTSSEVFEIEARGCE